MNKGRFIGRLSSALRGERGKNDVGRYGFHGFGFFGVPEMVTAYSGWVVAGFLPAVGNRDGASLSNPGQNCNYWSSSASTTAGQAYNLNFNSGNNFYPQNSNNRYNGNAVRLAVASASSLAIMFQLTREQLREDLDQAFLDACKGKNKKGYVKEYRLHFDENQEALCDELFHRRYAQSQAVSLPVSYPKPREVFAFAFRDCIVHHLYYNYTLEMFCRTFIQDTYSCIPDRGTAYGIERLASHIRQASLGYTVPCYVLRTDIVGFFTNIRRSLLYSLTCKTLHKMADHRIVRRVSTRWRDRLDIDFLDYLGGEIILTNPMDNCVITGTAAEWAPVPREKCLRYAQPDCGLPIGGLPSQMLQNVYMNPYDQWMWREKKLWECRYVDDAGIVSRDLAMLKSLIPEIRDFLRDELKLTLHMGKTKIYDVYQGVPFLGAYLKPGRLYVDKTSLDRMRTRIDFLAENAARLDPEYLEAALNSYLAVLANYKSFNLTCRLMLEEHDFSAYGMFSLDMKSFRAFHPAAEDYLVTA